MTKITITKDAMAKLEALTTTGSTTTMTDMEPENPGPLLKYMRSRNADRIEQLTAERDRLAGINVKLCDNFNTMLIDGASLEDRAKAAEAERDRLREALTAIRDATPRFDYVRIVPGDNNLSEPGSPFDRGKAEGFNLLQALARAALKGETP